MELASAVVETSTSLVMPGMEEAIILPIGDIQLDPVVKHRPRNVDLKRLRDTVAWGVENGAYFFGMGDYADVASPSNRAVLKAARLYDNISDLLTRAAEEALDELMEILEPTRGRWLGLLEGHHYWPFEDGTTTDTRLASFLGTRFLGTSTLMVLIFPSGTHKANVTMRLWAHHGRGSGTLLATPLNKLEHVLKAFDADVYLIGHHHKALAAKYPYLKAEGGERGGTPRLRQTERLLVSTGSYLKGYTQGNMLEGRAGGGYVEQAMLNPVALGSIAILARPYHDRKGYGRLDLNYMSI